MNLQKIKQENGIFICLPGFNIFYSPSFSKFSAIKESLLLPAELMVDNRSFLFKNFMK